MSVPGLVGEFIKEVFEIYRIYPDYIASKSAASFLAANLLERVLLIATGIIWLALFIF